MPEQPRSDFAARIEALRVEYDDTRALVDALLEECETEESPSISDILACAEEALRLSREIGYDRGEAVGLLEVGFVHYRMQRNQESFSLILEAQPRLQALDEPVAEAKCATVLAGLHNTSGNYQKALEHAHDALSRLEGRPAAEWQGWPEYMLGDAYRAMGELDRARDHYQRAYQVFMEIGMLRGLARALIGLGGVCRSLGDFDASEAHFTEARRLIEPTGNPVTMARVLSDLALLRQLMGNHDEALQLFEESLRIRREKIGGLIVATCLIDLGKFFLATGKPDEAIVRLDEALRIAEREDHKPRMFAAHEALSEAHCKKGDLTAALMHHQEYQRIKEDVMSADADTRFQNLEFSFEAAAAQKEADLVRKHNEELTRKNTELARLIQELKETQEMLIQSEKMASLGQLTAGIAHEIKNPLNFVTNFSVMTKDLAEELAEEISVHRDDKVAMVEADFRDLAAEIIANAERILEHGQRAAQIVNSMLVHSRQSGGRKMRVDVNELVLNCIDLAFHGFSADDESLEPSLECHFDDKAGTFSVIEDEMARVITNILNNAFYATHEHAQSTDDGFKPHVQVRTSRRHGVVEITIADNGPGIREEHKAKVFEPFFTTKPSGSGSGLGLSQSYEIVTKRHGGSLKVDDTPGGGATFVVGIPVA